LIKALFSEVPGLDVRVSKNPGHTKILNFYQVGKRLMLVDVPGYGFKQPQYFMDSVEHYIKTRKRLARTFFILDGHAGPQDWDKVALDMLEEFGAPYTMIMTKIDRSSASKRVRNLMKIQGVIHDFTSNSCFRQVFLVSSVTQEGLGLLQAYIAHITGHLDVGERS